MAHDTQADNGTSRKRGRLRRWLRWVLVVVVCLLAVYAVIDQVLMKMLAGQTNEFREQGRPTTFAEMGVGNLPPSENAAVIYRSAARDMNDAFLSVGQEDLRERFHDVTTCPRRRKDDDRDYAPLSEAELRTIEAHVQALEPALDKVLEARTMPGCEFGSYAAGGAVSSTLLPELADVRVVARNVAYKAVWEAEQGNTAEALKWVAVNMRLANDLTGDPLFITGLVRVAVAAIAIDSLESMLHDRGLPENVPDELYQELAALRDRENVIRFFDGERCFAADFANSVQSGSNVFTRAFFYTPGITKLNNLNATIAEAMLEEDFAKRQALLESIGPIKARKPLSGITPKKGGITLPWNAMVEITAPALLSAVDAFHRQLAQAELARVALAIKAFHRDTGTYPETLGELAPRYLPELPRDPCSGEDFIYTKDESGFLLYSVGPNGMDDGGLTLTGPGGLRGDILWCGGLEPEP